MKIKITTLIIIQLVFFSLKTQAGVNPKNGNFYVSYRDIVFKDAPIKMNIERTYNSKISSSGWFGVGWGSDFETFLYTIPGGGVCIHNNGSGKRDIQNPSSWDLDNINKHVDELIEVMKAEGKLKTPDEITIQRNKLINDMQLRNSYWLRYLIKGKVKNIIIEPGTKLYSSCNCGGFAYLYVTENGYYRKSNGGITEFFDLNGKLVKLEDDKGNWVSLSYNDSLNIKMIEDKSGNKLSFWTNQNGMVVKIKSSTNKTATYKYENKNLVYSCDADENQYWHTYDKFSNMLSITYSDSSQMLLKYQKETQFITEVITQDGYKTQYNYTSKDDKEYNTQILYKNKNDSLIKTELRRWINKTKENGVIWVYKEIIITDNNDTVCKIFGEQLQMIDTIIHNREITAINYDLKGKPVKVLNNGGIINEIIFSGNRIKEIKNKQGVFFFNYSEASKPSSIVAADGRNILFPISSSEKDIINLIQDCKIILEQVDLGYYVSEWLSGK
jgi:YD repeat-containing protein